jgi:GntR family transcriptional regulator, arabinose operon transcriptional repressor
MKLSLVESGKPYELALKLREALHNGTWKPGALFPSQNVLAERYGLSVPTVREALSVLSAEGLIVQKRGRGTFVASPPALSFGMTTTHMDQPYYAELTGQITRQAEEHNLPLLSNHAAQIHMACHQMQANPIRAHLIGPVTNQYWEDIVLGTLEIAIPCVIFGCFEPLRHPYVGLDGAVGIRDAVTHLVGLGHQKIAMLTHEHEKEPMIWSRTMGFLQARKQWRLSEETAPLIELHTDPRSLHEVIVALLAHPSNAPTALLAYNDTQAIELLGILYSLGKRVPEDISLIGFDGICGTAQTTPPLTTVDTHIAATAEAVWTLALAQSGPARPAFQQIVLTSQLRQRATTAPPP